jgi:hypothetical protein
MSLPAYEDRKRAVRKTDKPKMIDVRMREEDTQEVGIATFQQALDIWNQRLVRALGIQG